MTVIRWWVLGADLLWHRRGRGPYQPGTVAAYPGSSIYPSSTTYPGA